MSDDKPVTPVDERKWMRRIGADQLTANLDSVTEVEIVKTIGAHVLSVTRNDQKVRAVFAGDEFRLWLAACSRYLLGIELQELRYRELEEESDDIPF